MNFFASECSSGCESGWTNYLEQSFLSSNPSHKANGFNNRKSSAFCDEHRENTMKQELVDDYEVVEEEEEEEDLSMVSDASSGPPHFCADFVDENQYQYTVPGVATLNKNGAKRHRNKEYRKRQEDEELPSFLDDTASSPLINFSKNIFAHTNNQASMKSVFHYPQGFSATQFQGGPAFQDHFGFLQPSPSGNQLQNNQWF